MLTINKDEATFDPQEFVSIAKLLFICISDTVAEFLFYNGEITYTTDLHTFMELIHNGVDKVTFSNDTFVATVTPTGKLTSSELTYIAMNVLSIDTAPLYHSEQGNIDCIKKLSNILYPADDREIFVRTSKCCNYTCASNVKEQDGASYEVEGFYRKHYVKGTLSNNKFTLMTYGPNHILDDLWDTVRTGGNHA